MAPPPLPTAAPPHPAHADDWTLLALAALAASAAGSLAPRSPAAALVAGWSLLLVAMIAVATLRRRQTRAANDNRPADAVRLRCAPMGAAPETPSAPPR